MEKYDSIANIASAGSHRVNMEKEERQMSSLFFGSLESVWVCVCVLGGVCGCVCVYVENILIFIICIFNFFPR